MKITCVGGGPAALYLCILVKLDNPAHEVTVLERNQKGTTYGWGVTYWSDTLALLEAHDPISARGIRRHSMRWRDGMAQVGGRTTTQAGDAGYAIGRHQLLHILAQRAQELGVRTEFGHDIHEGTPLPDAELIVAADGMHSRLRSKDAQHFGTHITSGKNRFLWLGTTKVFTTFSFAFVHTAHGWLWCYAYGFSPTQSTCVIECSPSTWRGLGLDTMGQEDCLRFLEQHFATLLDGHPLISREDRIRDGQNWQAFRTVTNRTWSHNNVVLLGDAAHSTHFSIGAGTALALQDAVVLAEQLRTVPEQGLATALAQYEKQRKHALLPVQSAARHSAQWYESLPRYLRLPPDQMFALLGQRHSPLLPYVPPGLYYRLDRAASRVSVLRSFKRWLGPRIGRTVQRSSNARTSTS
ncbi:FAD-dependent monooxygenase [Streptomyces sp. B-S-A8]|uniref:FAD-dependent monooxygenase n=1 Tax=Streptomyces solicavernae TaxID=3043614 RepID=A0ABT6RVQ4_9ACTN|nr:FAD-dependent monooxygenase [Streptomyces sp. B-S-A8]MDI3388477.1 FAD-dependent monooxygenase [Streptomyces sp. B-S-A8]